MDLALSRLSRYTSRQLTANDLEDPFKKDTAKSISERFNNPNRNNNPSYQAQLAERDSVRADFGRFQKPNACQPSIWKAVQRVTPDNFI